MRFLVVASLLCCVAAGTAAIGARAAGEPANEQQKPSAGAVSPAVPGGSVQAFADAVADAVRARAEAEGWRGPVRLLLDDSRGVDLQKARTTLLPRVKRALKNLWAPDGPLKARLALSEEAGQLWAVIVVDGAGLDGPSTIVISARLDRELSSALGAVGKLAQGRFLLERKGTLPPLSSSASSSSASSASSSASPVAATSCPVLDAALVDFDGDPALELAVLSRCGVEVFRVDDSPRLERVAGPFALPEPRGTVKRWPRVALGWLVAVPSRDGDRGGERSGDRGLERDVRAHTLWAATSAGHSVFIDVRAGTAKEAVTPAPEERVPLRSVSGPAGPMALHWRFGSPELSLPLVSPGGIDVVVPGLPTRLRDLVRYPGGDAWVFVAEDGSLLARDDDGALQPLAPERAGDRILLVDIDADGEPELVTSSASSPGEPDQLVLRRLGPGLASSTVLLKSPLAGGSITGIAAGHVDYDARLDVVIIEELPTGESQIWRLEHAP